MNNYPEKIYDLLESLPFENLNTSDQEFILQHMTEVEYTQMRNIWSQAQKETGFEKQADPKFLNELENAFDQQHKQTIPMWKQSIPLYKVAAAILIPVIAIVLYYEQFRLKNSGDEVISIADTVYVKGSTDTVFIKEPQKPRPEPKIIHVITSEKEILKGSIPLSADSTYRELTSGII